MRGYHIGQEGTIRDTPSGYINDPSVHRPFKEYRKAPTITQPEILSSTKSNDEIAQEIEHASLLQREDLRYDGYTTVDVQRAKHVALTMSSTESEMREAIASLERVLVEFVDSASGDSGLIKRRDCHHVRYILSILCRRVMEISRAQVHLDAILDDEPMNTDAIEGRLEIIVGTAGRIESELKQFLDTLAARDPNYVTPAYLFLADFLVTSAGEYYHDHGEGATSVYFLQALTPIARSIGPEHTSVFLQATFNALDELHQTIQQYKQSVVEERRTKGQDPTSLPAQLVSTVRETIGLNVAFLKTVLSRNLAQFVPDPILFEYHVLRKLYVALQGAERRPESYGIAERLLKLFREHRELLTEADEEESYRVTFFQYIHDRSRDAPVVGKTLCMEAIEEYPNSSIPWKLLSVVLHQSGEVENALIAAHKALTLTPNDVSVLLLLANLHKVNNQPAMSSEYMERYKMIVVLQEHGLDEADVDSMLHAPLDEDSVVTQRHEERKARDDADMTEHLARYRLAHLYSKETITAPASTIRREEVHNDPELNTDLPLAAWEKEAEAKEAVKKKEAREGLDESIRLSLDAAASARGPS